MRLSSAESVPAPIAGLGKGEGGADVVEIVLDKRWQMAGPEAAEAPRLPLLVEVVRGETVGDVLSKLYCQPFLLLGERYDFCLSEKDRAVLEWKWRRVPIRTQVHQLLCAGVTRLSLRFRRYEDDPEPYKLQRPLMLGRDSSFSPPLSHLAVAESLGEPAATKAPGTYLQDILAHKEWPVHRAGDGARERATQRCAKGGHVLSGAAVLRPDGLQADSAPTSSRVDCIARSIAPTVRPHRTALCDWCRFGSGQSPRSTSAA